MLRSSPSHILRLGAQTRTAASLFGASGSLELSASYSSLTKQTDIARLSGVVASRYNGSPNNSSYVFASPRKHSAIRSSATATTTIDTPASGEVAVPEEEEEWRPPNIVQKKALKVWALRDKPPKKNFTALPRIRRGWMNQKYNNLKIEDVIKFICLDKKKHQQITYDMWMHQYKHKLYPKGIIFLFHLNNIPYGKPWRNLALTKGCFYFLEDVREGKLDELLEELYDLKPPTDPRVLIEQIVTEREAAAKLRAEARRKRRRVSDDMFDRRNEEEDDDDDDEDEGQQAQDKKKEEEEELKKAEEELSEEGEEEEDDVIQEGYMDPKVLKREKIEDSMTIPMVTPLPYRTRPFVVRNKEALAKLKQWKKQQSAEKIAAHAKKLQETEEEWRRNATPAWLAKVQAEKAARAAASKKRK